MPRFFALISRKALPVLSVALVCLTPNCSELDVEVLEEEIAEQGPNPDPGPVPLPDGFVDVDRPPPAELTFPVPCPLGMIPDEDNIVVGCPTGLNCIPAVDFPEWGTIADVKGRMLDFERVVVIERDGMIRGVPIKILIHHEIVNMCWKHDDGSQSYSFLTYCPIVDVAVHFDRDFPCFQGRLYTHGVSSLIHNGNLIVFRRGQAHSPEQLREAVFVQMYGGGLNSNCLKIEPVNIDMPWHLFKRLYPRAEILTENTGFNPQGGYDAFEHPYKEFWASPDLCVNGLCFPVSPVDGRMRKKKLVFGLHAPGERKVYTLGLARNRKVINDRIGGKKNVVWAYQRAVTAYEAVVDGLELNFEFAGADGQDLPLFRDLETESLWTFGGICVRGELEGERLAPMIGYRSFWYAWAALFPDTGIYQEQ